MANLLCDSLFAAGRHQGGGVAVAESLGPEELSVARTAMDLLVGPITRQRRVQWTLALRAAEALLVPHRSLGQLLFGGEHGATATWASLAGRRLDRRRVRIVEWLRVRELLFTTKPSML